MPMDRSKYPPNWRAISKQIREREGQRCKWCKAPNHETIVRDGNVYFTSDLRMWDAVTGQCFGHGYEPSPLHRTTRVVLTVAHLNAPGDVCRCEPLCANPEHLAALCQRCHLNYDRERHERNRRENRRAQMAVRDLFAEAKP